MNNDDAMDRLLRESMTDEAPQLSPAFDAKVMATVSGRPLKPWARLIMAAYIVMAVALVVWTMRDLSVVLMAVSVGGGALAALALSRYARAVAIEGV